MGIENVVHGRNSVLYDSNQKSVLYEKLSNTIHVDTRSKLGKIQERVEAIDYHPIFETHSLKKKKESHLGVLLLEVTEQCNLNCSYCIYSEDYPHERDETPKNMSFETAKKVIDEIVPQSNGSMLIGFYGGEPMLNMKLIRSVIDYTRTSFPSEKLTFSMTSNFVHADRHIPEIVDNEMYINVSLDGPKKIHDRSRKTKTGQPTYDKVIENLSRLEEYAPGYADSHIFILSTCEDPNEMVDIVNYFDASDYFVTNINSVDSRGKTTPIKKASSNVGLNSLMDEFRARILRDEEPKMLRRCFDNDLKSMAIKDDKVMPKKLMLNGSCYPGKVRLFVDVDGNYHPCERFGPRLKIGTAGNQVQKEVVEELIDYFAQIRTEVCGKCWGQRVCTPCLQHAKDPEGEISPAGLVQTCDGKKKGLLIGLDNYITLMQLDKKRTNKYIKTINPLFERG